MKWLLFDFRPKSENGAISRTMKNGQRFSNKKKKMLAMYVMLFNRALIALQKVCLIFYTDILLSFSHFFNSVKRSAKSTKKFIFELLFRFNPGAKATEAVREI